MNLKHLLTFLSLGALTLFISCTRPNHDGLEADAEDSEKIQMAEDSTNEFEAKAEEASEEVSSFGSLGESEKPAETQAAEAPPIEAALEDNTEASFENFEAEAPKIEETPSTELAEATPTIPPIVEPKAEEKEIAPESSPRKSFSAGKVPSIPSEAISRNGTQLNRFYMARKGDNPKKVSNLLYGDAAEAKNLSQWNKGWQPGQVIYYRSPENPEDKEMRSFYQERNVTPDTYVTKKGDWLSRVAKKEYGHPDSWKEIAVVNGIQKPATLSAGTKIALYPKDLTPFSIKNAPATPPVAEKEPEPVAPTAPVPTPAPVVAEQTPPPVMQEPPKLEEAPLPPPEEKPRAKPPKMAASAEEGTDFSKMLDQNMIFFLIATAVMVLTLVGMRMRKKGKSKPKQAGFDDGDDFEEPTPVKSKRQ